MQEHTIPAEAVPRLPDVKTVSLLQPLQWLQAGLQDLLRTRGLGLFYGGLFALMGLGLQTIYATRWQLTMGLTAGFFLLGPFVCTGLYELSRQRARGETPSLLASLICWRRNLPSIAFFAVILTFAMIVWARVSIVIFALFSNTDFPSLKGIIAQVVSFNNLEFIGVWAGVGFVFSSLVFAISVISVPLMLDRGTDTMMAVFSSARALWLNTATLYVWAALIVLLIGSCLVYFLPGLLVVAPVVGHATWHAYRALIAEE